MTGRVDGVADAVYAAMMAQHSLISIARRIFDHAAGNWRETHEDADAAAHYCAGVSDEIGRRHAFLRKALSASRFFGNALGSDARPDMAFRSLGSGLQDCYDAMKITACSIDNPLIGACFHGAARPDAVAGSRKLHEAFIEWAANSADKASRAAGRISLLKSDVEETLACRPDAAAFRELSLFLERSHQAFGNEAKDLMGTRARLMPPRAVLMAAKEARFSFRS